jgi:hypothetical protein
MKDGRLITNGEWRALSAGLAAALRAAGAEPIIVPHSHPAAKLASLWRGGPTILTRGDAIWWGDAPDDLSANPHTMAVLQHELQHVLDYRLRLLSAVRYLANPLNWTYRWRLQAGRPWQAFGAEQRASMAEQLWRIEHGLAPPDNLYPLRKLIPWASS